MTPTYDQLVAEAKKRGITMSDYDLALARENPTAGFGILNAQSDYLSATTPEAKALAHSNAEQWRNQYGYSGGNNGYGYNPILPQSTGNGMLDSKTSQLTSFPAYQNNLPAPTWDDSYGAKYDAALNSLVDYAPFSYDYKTDPLYSSYKQAYTREGQRASADALGQAAAATGGIPSSFATTAAAQAGNYYAAQLADKIPELYQLAYNQYADQYNRLSNNVGALQNARSFDFGTYQTALDQYNADRNFDYGVYSDDFNRLASQIGVLTDQDNTAYAREQAALKAAGRGGNPTPETPAYGAGIPTELYKQLVQSKDANAIASYWSQMTQSQQNALASIAGLTVDELRSGMGANADLVAPLLAARGFDAGSERPDTYTNAVSDITDYASAVKVLKNYGISETPATATEWNKTKNTWSKQFDSYAEYLKAWVYSRLT